MARRPVNYMRNLMLSIFIIVITWSSYLRLTGRENIRPIHIVNLVTIGVGIGLFLTSLLAFIRDSNEDKR